MAFHLKRNKSSDFKLGASKNLSLLTWLAHEKGFFADENLRPRFQFSPYAKRSMEDLIEGKVDCAILVEINVAYLGYLKPKIPIKCLASLESRLTDSFLLRHQKNEKPTPSDIRGKTIGFAPRTSSHSFLYSFLNHYGLDRRDIKIKSFTPQALPNALMRGEVDGISCFEPYIYQATIAMNELGLPYTLFSNTGFYTCGTVFATTKPFLIKNKKPLEAFLKALKRAENFSIAKPEQALSIIANKIKLAGHKSDEIWRQYNPKLGPISFDYIHNIELLGEWIGTNDTEFQGHPKPDYSDLIDNSLFFDIFGKNPL